MTRYVLPIALSIPYGDVDSEHGLLVDILNSMATLFEAKQDTEPHSIRSLLKELREALAAHISHEEQEMAKLGYPGLAKHKRDHALCSARLNAIFQTVISNQIEISQKLLDEIFNVIISDAMEPDLGFKSFLFAKGLLE